MGVGSVRCWSCVIVEPQIKEWAERSEASVEDGDSVKVGQSDICRHFL